MPALHIAIAPEATSQSQHCRPAFSSGELSRQCATSRITLPTKPHHFCNSPAWCCYGVRVVGLFFLLALIHRVYKAVYRHGLIHTSSVPVSKQRIPVVFLFDYYQLTVDEPCSSSLLFPENSDKLETCIYSRLYTPYQQSRPRDLCKIQLLPTFLLNMYNQACQPPA